MYDSIQKEKIRLSTPRLEMIDNLINYYKTKSENWNSSTGKILHGIYERNKAAALEDKEIKNTNLLEVIAKPEPSY